MAGIRLLTVVVLGLCLACGGAYASQLQASPSAGEAAPPNIVLFISDDQKVSTLSEMPNVQRLFVGGGKTFSGYTTTYPLCCPSRATMLTGKYAHNTGVYENDAPHGGYGEFVEGGHEKNTTAARLWGAGYNTAYLGRYLHGFRGRSLPPGYDRFNAEIQAGPDAGKYTDRYGGPSPLKVPDGGTADSVIANRAVKLTREWAADDAPFFLTVGFRAPHAPAPSENRYRDRFSGERVPRSPSYNEADVSDKPSWVRDNPPLRKQTSPQSGTYCKTNYRTSVSQNDCLYRRMLRSLQTVDRAAADVAGALEEGGELDNTYFFYLTDNGLHLGEHRLKYGKLTSYSTDTGFPLLARGPGVEAGASSEKVTSNTDLAPTIAEVAGTEMPGADGRSLLPLLSGEPVEWRTAIFSERRVFPDDLAPKGGPQDVPEWEAVRTEGWSYVEYANGERELYDLEADPYQLENLLHEPSPEAEARAAEMSARMEALRGCAGATCRAAEGP